MSATTALGLTGASLGTLMCPFTAGLGCGFAVAASSIISGIGWAMGPKICARCHEPKNDDNPLTFFKPKLDKIIKEQQKLEGLITYEATKTRLHDEAWFKVLESHTKEQYTQYATVMSNQKFMMKGMQQMNDNIKSLVSEVQLTQIIALWGDDISILNNAYDSFIEMTRDELGGIVPNYLSEQFLKKSDSTIKDSMRNVIRMLTEGHPLKPESLWSLSQFCRNGTYNYFIGQLMQSYDLYSVSLHMQGHQVMQQETEKFKSDFIKITNKFVTECSNVVVEMTVANCKYILSTTNTCLYCQSNKGSWFPDQI